MNLPPGSAVWRATGGPLAWSSEDYFSSQIFHALNIANWQRTENGRKGKGAPTEPQPPEYAHVKKKRVAEMSSKAERFLARRQLKALSRPAEREAVKPE